MGGHGGLNILPQKRWNVYNYDNREKVRRDEEAAAKEEQLKREQSRKREAEFRLDKLRQARGLSTPSASVPIQAADEVGVGSSLSSSSVELTSENDSKHINLFEGIKIFDPIVEVRDEKKEKERNKKMKREAPPRVVTAEDDKYRLGYGVAGKGVKLPWYMAKLHSDDAGEEKDLADDDDSVGEFEFGRRNNHKGGSDSDEPKNKKRKKTLQELRDERLKRERKESEREKALFMDKSRRDRGFSIRR